MKFFETESERKILDLLCIDEDEQLAMEKNRTRIHKEIMTFDATKKEDAKHE